MKVLSLMLRASFALSSLILVARPSRSDTIELNDGTILRGKVITTTPQTIGFKTEEGRVLAIDRSDIKAVTRETPVIAPTTPTVDTPDKGARPAEPDTDAWKNKRVSFDFVDHPLDKVMERLSELSGITIRLDRQHVPEGRRVTLRVHDMPLPAAMNWICKACGVCYILKEGEIIVTTPGAHLSPDVRSDPEPKVRRTYDVRELLKDTKEADTDWAGRSIAEFITRIVAPGEWDKTRGVEIGYRAGKLALVHNQQVHDQVAKQVAIWVDESHREREKPGWREDRLPPLHGGRRVPSQKVTVEFTDAPLTEVLPTLSRQADTTIVVDDVLRQRDSKTITLRARDMDIAQALDAVCSQAGLGYAVLQGGIFVTTKRRALDREGMVVCSHYVAPLIRKEVTAERLAGMLKSAVAADTWDMEMSSGRPALAYVNGYLMVFHAPSVQRGIRAWLASLAAEGKSGPGR